MKCHKLVFVIGFLFVWTVGLAYDSYAEGPDVSEGCMDCHQAPDAVKVLDSGEKLKIFVDEPGLKKSVHESLRCVDCHFGYSADDHPKHSFKDQREVTLQISENCRRCHFDKFSQTNESIHHSLLHEGFTEAPVCVDCHGSHTVQSGRKEKLISARRCEKCHSAIYKTYTQSVHGAALLEEDNQDVPICSDCHTAHQMTDPRKNDFRNEIPQMCSNCHADEALMKNYGLSTSVLQSYLQDFHGVTLTFYKKQQEPVRHIAVCTDCHGIHDITKTSDPNSSVVMGNLQKRCQKCHPDAGENFPDTWISHYEPDWKRAPLVFAVNSFYKIFIPFMIVGLVLQILLHIWRYAVNR